MPNFTPEMLEMFEYAGIPVAALLSLLLEVIKRNGYIKKESIPLVSIVLGLVFGITMFSNGDLMEGIIKGLYLGLIPMGMYEGVNSLRG